MVQEVEQTAVPYTTDHEWFSLAITVTPTSAPAEEEAEKEMKDEQTTDSDETKKPDVEDVESVALPQKTFYYTFVVFPAGDSMIGAISDEPNRQKIEVLHRVTLTRPFAILDREISMEELIAFEPHYANYMTQIDAKPFRFAMGPSIRTISNGFRVALSPSVKSPEAAQGAKPLGVGTE